MTAKSKRKSTTSFSLFNWNKSDKDDKSTRNLLKDKIFGSGEDAPSSEDDKASSNERDLPSPKEKEEEDPSFWSNMGAFFNSSKEKEDENMDSLLNSARDFVKSGETAKVQSTDLRKELQPVMENLKNHFSELPLDRFDPASLMYHLEKEDEKKNPSWKRRVHRFCAGFDLNTCHQMHEFLYLAELAYVDSVEEIQEGIASFTTQSNDKYEVVFASAEGKPREPAHYLLITKEKPNKKSGGARQLFRWASLDESFLEVTLVVRGTKEFADAISDAMLEAKPYRDGLSHDGLCQSGLWIVEKHLPLLNHLLEESGRKQIKLRLIGHSLGAGAAAIACIEFNEQPNIDATCVAFCCPALLDLEQSNKWKDKITTIVADSDCVPRMSGATLYNLIIKLLECDYKDRAIEDVKSLLNVLTLKVPFLMPKEKHEDAIAFVKSKLDEKCKPLEPGSQQPQEVSLFPPGRCYHIYRDGVSHSFVEVGCDFFNELDVSMTMVDDHYLHSGCHKMFLELMRAHLGNSKFEFPNDLMGLRQEKDLRESSEEDDDDDEEDK